MEGRKLKLLEYSTKWVLVWLKKLENSREDLAKNPNKVSRLEAPMTLTSFFRHPQSSSAPLFSYSISWSSTPLSKVTYTVISSASHAHNCPVWSRNEIQALWEVQSSRCAKNSPLHLQDPAPCRVEHHTSKVCALARSRQQFFTQVLA